MNCNISKSESLHAVFLLWDKMQSLTKSWNDLMFRNPIWVPCLNKLNKEPLCGSRASDHFIRLSDSVSSHPVPNWTNFCRTLDYVIFSFASVWLATVFSLNKKSCFSVQNASHAFSLLFLYLSGFFSCIYSVLAPSPFLNTLLSPVRLYE